MSTGQNKEGNVPIGFAGMSQMVSDVDSLLRSARRQAMPPEPPAFKPAVASSPPVSHHKPDPSPLRPYILALGALILFVLATMLFGPPREQSVSITTPSSSALPNAPASRTPETSAPEQPSRFVEEKPSVGKDQILTRNQIQYCLAENIRLEAGQTLVHDTNNARAVEQFNNLIDDYNSRCAQFRYHRSIMETAKQEVERQRSALQDEGARRFHTIGARSPRSSSWDLSNPRATRENDVRFITPSPELEAKHPSPSVGRKAIDRSEAETASTEGTPTNSSVDSPLQADTDVNKDPCLDGSNPTLCKPELLSEAERRSVGSAERTGRSRQCADGQPLSLCDQERMPISEGDRADAAERARNLKECLDGRYPALCNHSLLTRSEASDVAITERSANLKRCMTGEHPLLCDHNLLTPAQAHDVEEAERRVMFAICMEGRYPVLCAETTLTPTQRLAIRNARAQRGALAEQ